MDSLTVGHSNFSENKNSILIPVSSEQRMNELVNRVNELENKMAELEWQLTKRLNTITIQIPNITIKTETNFEEIAKQINRKLSDTVSQGF